MGYSDLCVRRAASTPDVGRRHGADPAAGGPRGPGASSILGAQRVPSWQGGRAYEPFAMGSFGAFGTMTWMFMGGMMFGGGFDGGGDGGGFDGGGFDGGGFDGGGVDFGGF
jgi:hypothetical protein